MRSFYKNIVIFFTFASEVTNAASKPAQYPLHDEECQNTSFSSTLGQTYTWAWDGKKVVAQQATTHHIGSGFSLSSNVIEKTLYGLHLQSQCELVDGKVACYGGVDVKAEEMPLKICQNAIYPRNSVEGVALTAANHLENAFGFYQSLPEKKKLKKAHLLVLPLFSKSIKSSSLQSDLEQTMVNNMTYSLTVDHQPVFAVLPSSEARKPKDEGAPNLWESSWAVSHEYAHHVFMSHTGVQRLSNTSLKAALSSHKHDEGYDQKNFMIKDWDAVNEAFSDLFGFYSLKTPHDYSQGLTCLEQNRYILSNKFKDGTSKSITKDKLLQFYSLQPASSDCNSGDFRRLHIMSAAIASGMHEIFTNSPDAQLEQEYLGSLLLRWADRLKDLLKDDPGGINLPRLIEEGIKVVARGEENNQLSEAQCQVIENKFPVFSQKWVNNKFKCEF